MASPKEGAATPNSTSVRPDTPFLIQNVGLNKLLPDANKGSASPMTNELLIAARKGYSKEMERILMETGESAANVVDRHGRNCLHIACHYGHVQTVSVILRMDVIDINCTSKRGFTPLHEASAEGRVDVVLLLLAMGAFFKARSKEGWTALMSACYNGHYDVARILIAIGLDVNATNTHKFTALHVAAWKGNTSVIELLLKEGAIISMETQYGKSALDIAKEENQHESVTILQAASVRDSEKPFYRIVALEGQLRMLQEKLHQFHKEKEQVLSEERSKAHETFSQMKQQLLQELSQAKDEIAYLKETIESFNQTQNGSIPEEGRMDLLTSDKNDKSLIPSIQMTTDSPQVKKKKTKLHKVIANKQQRGSVGSVPSSLVNDSPEFSSKNQETIDILGLDTAPLTQGQGDLSKPRRSFDVMTHKSLVNAPKPNGTKLTITQLVEECMQKPGSMASIRQQLKADGLTPKIQKKFHHALPSMPEGVAVLSPRASSPTECDTTQDKLDNITQ